MRRSVCNTYKVVDIPIITSYLFGKVKYRSLTNLRAHVLNKYLQV